MSEVRERKSSRHQTDEHETQTDEHPHTTQEANCSQSGRTRIDKDTTLVNLASSLKPPTDRRLELRTQRGWQICRPL